MKNSFRIFATFILLTSFLFNSCQKEITTTVQKSIPFKFKVNDAIAYFNDNNKIIEKAGFFSPINAMSPSPAWESALKGRFRDVEFYEVPLTSKLGQLGVSPKSSNTPSVEDFWNINRLVIMKKADGSIEGKYMILIPDQSYLKNPDKKLDLETMSFARLPYDYSGTVQYYNLDGSFSEGWKYTNGEIAGNIKVTDNRSSIMARDAYLDCTTTTTDWYQYDPYNNTYYYLGSNSSTTCIPTGGSSGGSSTTLNVASLWNNTNGTGGGTYNSGGSLAGETVDAVHPLCPNSFVFKSLGPNGKAAGLSAVNLGLKNISGTDFTVSIPYMYFSVFPQTTAIDVANLFNTTLDMLQNRINAGFLDRFAGNQSQILNAVRAEFLKSYNLNASVAPNFGGSSQVLMYYNWDTFITYQTTRVFPTCQ